MQNIGIIDIGSNTVVLLIYEISQNSQKIIYHESSPVHLISYLNNNHMDQEGIDKAYSVLKHYQLILKEKHVDQAFGFITEPGRNIDNLDQMLETFESTGIQIAALSGKEEAIYDFLGSRIDTKDVASTFAFDVGGGSSELVHFQNNEIKEAISIPVGCVRLSKLPIKTETVERPLKKALEDYPNLQTTSETIIGIGGTVRAAALVLNERYQTGRIIQVSLLEQVFQEIMENNPETLDLVHQVVDKGRWDVFAPGLNMVLAIARITHAKTIVASSGCVRDGFLNSILKNK